MIEERMRRLIEISYVIRKKRVYLLLILTHTLFLNAMSQNIFEYERDISKKGNYEFYDVDFDNTTENIRLSGTLITPKSSFEKVIVIVPGSGKDTRNSHPKLVEHLLENNIAVYRFDERGVGNSNGEQSEALNSLIIDLNFCISTLLTVDKIKDKKIGLLGHSLGGLATIKALYHQPNIHYLIQISTPVNAGQSFKSKTSEIDIFKNQKNSIEDITKTIDTFNYIIHNRRTYSEIIEECERVRKKLKIGDFISKAYLNPSIIDIVKQSNELDYNNIKIPTLYIIGEKDENIDVDYGITKLRTYNNRFIDIEVLDDLDHYLTLNNGLWQDYRNSIDREIDSNAANKIIEWILKI